MRPITDEEIIQGLQNSDAQVIQQVYQLYLPAWVNLLRKLGGNESDARDVFQDALLGIFVRLRKKEAFELRVAFSTYLFAVCKKQWAYRRRSSSRLKAMKEDSVEIVDDQNLGQALERAEKYRFFRRHVDQLGGRCSEILQLHFQKLNNEAIATALGLSPTYVKKRKFLCKQALKEAVQKDPSFSQY